MYEMPLWFAITICGLIGGILNIAYSLREGEYVSPQNALRRMIAGALAAFLFSMGMDQLIQVTIGNIWGIVVVAIPLGYAAEDLEEQVCKMFKKKQEETLDKL